MKKRRFWLIRPIGIALIIICLILLATLFFTSKITFFITAPFTLIAVYLCGIKLYNIQKELSEMISMLSHSMTDSESGELLDFPIPATIISEIGEVIWYNELFKSSVLQGGNNVYGQHITTVLGRETDTLIAANGTIVECQNKFYRCYSIKKNDDKKTEKFYLVYLVDVDALERTRIQSIDEKPVIMLALVDNYEDSIVNTNEGNSARLISDVQKHLQDFADKSDGLVKKLSYERYLIIMEHQSLQEVIAKRFDILDRVREIETEGSVPITLSIGVAPVETTLLLAEQESRQALDMALGRGGDQVAMKTPSGYEFFGGYSKGIEKRTKVKTRIVANAIAEMINAAGNVLVMGHRFADLDSMGSSIGMAKACSCMGKPVNIVVDPQRNLSEGLIQKLIENDKQGLILRPELALESINEKTLLIIVDTHAQGLLENIEVYKKCKNVIIIDHHRKLVDHIEDAAIFYHEPYASSASEMVTELVQYLGNNVKLTQLEGEALLSGIMLDTKNFVLRAGVRTFEAAAYLRRVGADTVLVRQLFSSSMDAYQQRAKVISGAEIYKECAIATCDEEIKNIRIIAPQAADELLNISGIKASFVLYEKDDVIYVSARSMGAFNVQVMMEALGGGGHHTMAAAQVPDSSMESVITTIYQIIDKQTEYNIQRD